VRFQDAAKDARAVVYAGIQADPQVARTAVLLADATPAQRVLARAVMNGETTDAEGWRVMRFERLGRQLAIAGATLVAAAVGGTGTVLARRRPERRGYRPSLRR
jgi:hypothetical protein